MSFRALTSLRPRLSRSLRRSEKSCRRLVSDYVQARPETMFASQVTAALSALTAAAERVEQHGSEREGLLRAVDACAAAAEACRSHGLDRTLLRAADAFQRARTVCADAAAQAP